MQVSERGNACQHILSGCYIFLKNYELFRYFDINNTVQEMLLWCGVPPHWHGVVKGSKFQGHN